VIGPPQQTLARPQQETGTGPELAYFVEPACAGSLQIARMRRRISCQQASVIRSGLGREGQVRAEAAQVWGEQLRRREEALRPGCSSIERATNGDPSLGFGQVNSQRPS